MSQKTSELEPALRWLERQAAESIHEDTDLLTVVRAFDFSDVAVYKGSELEWNACYGHEPMVRAFYCKELAGLTTPELHEYLANGLPKQDTETLEDVRMFVDKLLEERRQSIPEADLPEQAEPVDDDPEGGGTIVEERVKCGSDCTCNDGTGHGRISTATTVRTAISRPSTSERREKGP